MVTSDIAKCTEDVSVIKTFSAHGNCKLWMTTEVRSLLTAQYAAFRVGDMTALHSARSVLLKGIKAAKGTYAEKSKGHLCNKGNTRWMSQGDQAQMDDKSGKGSTTMMLLFQTGSTSMHTLKYQTRQPEGGLLPQSGHRPQMLQNIHYNTSCKEISCILS